MEAEAHDQAEAVEAEGKRHPGVPGDKAQRNFTDPESRIMPAPGGKAFLQAYNCQAVVDHEHQVIVATRATNVASDKGQAVVMIEEVIANTGAVPKEVSTDAGYYSATAVAELQALVTDPFVAPEKTRSRNRRNPRPWDASPGISRPGTGCAASCRPSEAGSVTGYAWRRWNRSSARSSRGEGSGGSCCGDWRKCRASGR